jgi:2-oxoisovalerate dehydrogenase E2 component (dihydrolipoyl transacylase)
MRLPDLGEGLVSAEVVEWHVKPGDFIEEDQPLVEMSTDKAVVEVPSPVTGQVISLTGAPGEVIAVGAELAVFERKGEASAEPLAEVSPTPAPTAASIAVRASPAMRRAAREAGIDLATVSGTGPGGRILRTDLEGQMGQGYEDIPVIGVRRVIAQRMSEAKRLAPHFAYVEEVDVTALELLRQRLNAEREASVSAVENGRPLSYLPFIARALINVLKEFPQGNAHYDESRNVLRQYRSVHLGIATHTPHGLKVPVLREAQRFDLIALGEALRAVTAAAREGRARREDLTGSTITLTSLGKLGGIVSTPILNLPEVAIIGINKAIERVVVHDGKIAIRRVMNLSSSFDHRFVDGYDAAAMIQRLKLELEQPEQIFRPG